MELEFSSDERLSGTERNGEARGHLRKNGGGLHEDERLPDSGIPSESRHRSVRNRTDRKRDTGIFRCARRRES